MLCLLIVKNKLKMKGVQVFGIPKWRWKQEKNKLIDLIVTSNEPDPMLVLVNAEDKNKDI